MYSSTNTQSVPERAAQAFEQNLVVGFYDLNSYRNWASSRNPLEVLKYLGSYFEETSAFLNSHGGLFVKAIGDAGLFIFPGSTRLEIDHAIETTLNFHAHTNRWLCLETKELQAAIQMNWGTVACGYVGATSDKRFDVYGETVNAAALIRTNHFAVTTTLYEETSEVLRGKFRKTERDDWEFID